MFSEGISDTKLTKSVEWGNKCSFRRTIQKQFSRFLKTLMSPFTKQGNSACITLKFDFSVERKLI